MPAMRRWAGRNRTIAATVKSAAAGELEPDHPADQVDQLRQESRPVAMWKAIETGLLVTSHQFAVASQSGRRMPQRGRKNVRC